MMHVEMIFTFFLKKKKKLNTLTLLYKVCTIIVHKTLLYLGVGKLSAYHLPTAYWTEPNRYRL